MSSSWSSPKENGARVQGRLARRTVAIGHPLRAVRSVYRFASVERHRARQHSSRPRGKCLSTVVFLAVSFPGEPQAQMSALIRRYVEDAANREWPLMAREN